MTMSHPRRQELDAQLSAAVALGLSAISFAAVFATVGAGLPRALVALPCATAILALVRMRNANALAARARIGRRSEQIVARRLHELASEGWTTRHSITWHARGDIDHITISPRGVVFVIETKTRSYGSHHLDRTRAAARALARRGHCAAVRPVLCVARGRSIHTVQRDVLVVSEDLLASTLRDADNDLRSPED